MMEALRKSAANLKANIKPKNRSEERGSDIKQGSEAALSGGVEMIFVGMLGGGFWGRGMKCVPAGLGEQMLFI